MKKQLLSTMLFAGALLIGKNVHAQTPPNDVCGTILNFDGTDDGVLADIISTKTSNFSATAWIKPTINDKTMVILYNGNTSTNGWGLFLTDNGQLMALHGGKATARGSEIIPTDIWTHVALVNNAGTTKLYMNGSEVYTGNITTPVKPNDSFRIGTSGSTEYFNGSIDHITIWDKALDSTEISVTQNEKLSGNETDLIAYYDFDGTTYNDTLYDQTTFKKNGVLKNMDPATDWTKVDGSAPCETGPPNDECGTVLNFDGSNDYVLISNDTALDTDDGNFSLSLWFNATNGSGSTGLIETANSDFSAMKAIRNIQGKIETVARGDNAPSETPLTSPNTYNDGEWHHAVSVYESGVLKLFIDGTNVGEKTVDLGNTNTNDDWFIGQTADDISRHFDGKLDEVSVWKKALSPIEIAALFSKSLILQGNEADLVAYYDFNEGLGQTLLDKSQNNLHGALINMDPSTDWTKADGSSPCELTPPNDDCGTVLNFDGTDDYLIASPSSDFETTEQTIELWVYPQDLTPGYDPLIIGNRQSAVTRWSYHFANGNDEIVFWNNTVQVRYSYDFEEDNWYHLAFVHGGGFVEVFVNGTSIGKKAASNGNNTGLPLVIGSNGTGEYLTARIDEVRIWSTMRTASDINTTMNTVLQGDENGLLLYSDFNDGAFSDTLYDLSDNGNNSVLTNMDAATDWTKADGSAGGNSNAFITATDCDSYTSPSGDSIWTESGIYFDFLTNRYGCDSIITIDLTINNSNSIELTETACDSYDFAGETLTSSGFYYDTLANISGCDSIVVLDLTIQDSPDNNITAVGPELSTTATSGTFEWINCDNNAVLGTSSTYTATVSGDYSVVVTDGVCIDTADCEMVTITALDNSVEALNWSAYPNPTNGDVSIKLDKTYGSITLKITSLTGELVASKYINNVRMLNMEIDEPKGIYFVEITTPDGTSAIMKVIKE